MPEGLFYGGKQRDEKWKSQGASGIVVPSVITSRLLPTEWRRQKSQNAIRLSDGGNSRASTRATGSKLIVLKEYCAGKGLRHAGEERHAMCLQIAYRISAKAVINSILLIKLYWNRLPSICNFLRNNLYICMLYSASWLRVS